MFACLLRQTRKNKNLGGKRIPHRKQSPGAGGKEKQNGT